MRVEFLNGPRRSPFMNMDETRGRLEDLSIAYDEEQRVKSMSIDVYAPLCTYLAPKPSGAV